MPEQFLGTYSMFHLMQVAQIAVRAVLQSSGQNCAGAERFYVHRDIYSSFVSEVTKIVKSVSVVSMSVLTCFMHRYLFS
jgi:acyl-CoA reductase-like NAD-dependent aldehyde dehydrogenase